MRGDIGEAPYERRTHRVGGAARRVLPGDLHETATRGERDGELLVVAAGVDGARGVGGAGEQSEECRGRNRAHGGLVRVWFMGESAQRALARLGGAPHAALVEALHHP